MAQVRNNRFPMMLSDDETEAIEAYRWRNQIGSKAKAARILIEKGLAAENSEGQTAPTVHPSK
jgi:hypothetical protein